MDIASTFRLGSKEKTVSFYFTEFPDTHGAKEMLKAFAFHGKVLEVVIPPKKNKRGQRFGFVRFVEVHDPRVFAVKLDNMIFGASKICVNIPRFERDNKEALRVDKGKRELESIRQHQGCVKEWREVVKGNKETIVRREEPTTKYVKPGRSEDGEGEGRGTTSGLGRT